MARNFAFGILFVGFLPFLSISLAQESDSKPKLESESQQLELHDTERQIEQITAAIASFSKSDSEKEFAETYATRLAKLRESIDSTSPRNSDEPELHAVVAGEGINAPDGVLEGRDRFAFGYVKVEVTHTKTPIVLLLSSQQSIHWDIDLSPGVEIKAVVLWGGRPDKSRLAGIPADTLISRELPLNKWRVYARSRLDPNFLDFQDMAEAATGMPIKTFQSTPRYVKPIVVGPQSETWRLDYARDDVLSLQQEVIAKQQEKVLREFAKLRFHGTYSTGNPGSHRGDGTSTADFSLLGPIERTIRPNRHPVRQLLDVEKENAVFGLNRSQIALIEENRQPTPIPFGRAVADRRFTGLCYDKAKHRLLAAGTSTPFSSKLYEFDFAKNEWSKLMDVQGTLFGIAFDDANQRMLGLIQSPAPKGETSGPSFGGSGFSTGGVSMSSVDYPRMPVEFVAFDDGKLESIARLKLPYTIQADKVIMNNSYQLAIAGDGHVVLLTPRIRHARNQTKSYLSLLNSKTGDLLYTGESRPHDGTKLVLAPQKLPPPQGGGELAMFWKQQDKTESAITQAAETDPDRLPGLNSQLAEINAQLSGGGAKLDKPQLHWVGLYEGPRATVKVTETRQPIVLALSSYESVSWTIEAAKGVKIQRILTFGYEKQELAKIPDGVATKDYARGGGGGGPRVRIGGHRKTDSDYVRSLGGLKQLTGLEVTTFHGNYAGGDFEIGPTDSKFRMQQALQSLKQLEKDALSGALNRRVAALASITFPAVYQAPPEPAKDGARPGRRRMRFGEDQKRYLAKFTLKGPVRGTFEELEVRDGEVIPDPSDPTVRFLHNGDGVSRMTDGVLEPLPMDPKLPRISWGDSIALDSKRRRLLFTSHGGSGHLYTFDLKTEKWSLLRTPGLSASAITYSPEEDALYGVSIPGGEPTLDKLRKYKANGELIREVNIVPRIVLPGHGFRGNTAQLRYSNGTVFLITARLPPSADPENGPTEHLQIPWIYVIDAESGEILHDQKLQPHAGQRKFSQQDLQKLWDSAAANLPSKALDDLAWKFAAGHSQTVKFLAGKFVELDSAIDVGKVNKLIAELDDESFKVRSKASGELKSLGRKIEPQIERSLRRPKIAAETKARLRELIEGWRSNEPLDPQAKRDVMAINALERIGTAEAISVIRKLSRGPAWAVRTSRAKATLEAMNK